MKKEKQKKTLTSIKSWKKSLELKTNEQLNQYSNLFFNKIKKDIIINEL